MTSQPADFRPSIPLCSNLSAMSTFTSDLVDEEAVTQLGFEPCRLWRHDLTGVRYGHQIGHRNRKQRKGDGRAAGIDMLLQRPGAARPADKVDAPVGPHIGN